MERFQAMSLFVAVADNGSFQEAARLFDLSPPAVTRAIAALEKRLDVKLLHRTTRQVRLTEVGTSYLEDCRRILSDLQEAEESTSGSYRAPRGTLHVTAPVLFGQTFVLPALLDFLDLYPEVRGRTLFVDRVVNLLDEGLDVALRIGQLADSALIASRVGQTRRVLCASPGYLEKHGVPAHPAELNRHRLCLSSGLGSAAHLEFSHGLDKLRQPVSCPLTVSSNIEAIRAAVAGWGLTRVLSYQIVEELSRGQLQIVLPEFEPEPWPIYVLHQEGHKVSAKVRAFVDFLVRRLRQLPALS
ncbi:LysR family transcriptional regulator [bacterium]|nr:LysR family transcriptional regulator [bacterium]